MRGLFRLSRRFPAKGHQPGLSGFSRGLTLPLAFKESPPALVRGLEAPLNLTCPRKDQDMTLPQLLTPKEAAALLRVSEKTLEDWRRTGKGPKSYRLEKRAVRYCLADVSAWLEGCQIAALLKEPVHA